MTTPQAIRPTSKPSLRTRLAKGMWFFWGFMFSPLKLFGFVSLETSAADFSALTGPIILASNHRHPIDPLTIGIAIFPSLTARFTPLAPYVAPLHRLQRPGQRVAKAIGFIQAVYALFDVIEIPEAVSFSDKLSPLHQAVRAQKNILIFPEGRSFQETTPRPFKNGVAALHLTTGAPVVPCAIHYYRTGWRRRAVVSIGKPLHLTQDDTAEPDMTQAAALIREAVAAQYNLAVQSVY